MTPALAYGSIAAGLVALRGASTYATAVGLDATVPSSIPPVSVVIPLKGWDDGLPTLLRALASQEGASEIDVVVVADEGHPRDADLRVEGTRVVHPSFRVPTFDKAARLREGLAAARHDLVMFLDSDAEVDASFVRHRIATHLAEGAPDLSFSIPLYAHPRGLPTRFLAALTAHSNLTIYLFAQRFLRMETAIGPCIAFRKGDGFMDATLATIARGVYVADDHAIGRMYAAAGRRVVVAAEPIRVAKGDGTTAREVVDQILRWMVLARIAPKTASAKAIAILAASVTVSLGAPVAAYVGIGALALRRGGATTAWPWFVAAGAIAAMEAAWIVAVEARLLRRAGTVPWGQLVFVPLFLAAQGAFFAASLVTRKYAWRGATLDVRLGTDGRIS